MINSLIIASITGVITYLYRTLAIPTITHNYRLLRNINLSRGITFLELLSILASLILNWHFPVIQSKYFTILALVFTWGLLMLSYIDVYYLIIPNVIVKPLWVLGILVNMEAEYFASKQSALLGSFVGYSSLWLIANAYWRLKKRIGLGGGDIKLFGVLGAWLGIEALPSILWLASSSGLCSGIIWLIISKKGYHTPIPFGPFLALGGWVYLLGYNTL